MSNVRARLLLRSVAGVVRVRSSASAPIGAVSTDHSSSAPAGIDSICKDYVDG